MRFNIYLLICCFFIFATGCASLGPAYKIDSIEGVASINNWNQQATDYDPGCYNLYTKYDKWGVFIGCQAIDIFDVRTENAYKLFTDNLSRQSCTTKLGTKGQRNYVRTGHHFLFVDKTGPSGNVWFVPAHYYSDGVSTPDVLREILPGAILDTESPRTLSAALFHDRYFCLFEYSGFAWSSDRENYPQQYALENAAIHGAEKSLPIPAAYRRKGCANVSFRNGLRAAGASSFISTLFRGMVGLVNPGKVGYCPKEVHTNALGQLEVNLSEMLGYGPIGDSRRTELPGCHAKEPLVLCLSNVQALWYLVSLRDDDYDLSNSSLISDEWRQVLTRIMCYDLQARYIPDYWPEEYDFSLAQAEEVCGFIQLNYLVENNEDLRDPLSALHTFYTQDGYHIESPFRAGDFFVEGALMLKDRQEGAETFLRTLAGVTSIDYAMLGLVNWNENHHRADYKDK